MRPLLLILCCMLSLTACSTMTARQRYESDLVDYRIQQSLKGVKVDEVGIPASAPPDMPNPEPVTAGQVLGTIIALPLVVPLAALSAYPYPYVHCQSWTYKDRYHTICY